MSHNDVVFFLIKTKQKEVRVVVDSCNGRTVQTTMVRDGSLQQPAVIVSDPQRTV